MANGPGSPGPNAGRRKRRGRQVGSGAERQRYRAAPIDPGGTRGPPVRVRHTAERGWHRGRNNDLSSRNEDESGRFRFLGPEHHDRSAEPDRDQAPGRHGRHGAAPRDADRRPRDPHRRVPAPGRRRHARLPARVGRGRRAPRPLQLPGHRPAAAARGQQRHRHDDLAARRRRRLRARPARDHRRGARPPRRAPGLHPEAPGRARRRHAPVHRRRRRAPSRTTRSPRSSRRSRSRTATRSASRWPASSRPTSSSSSTT